MVPSISIDFWGVIKSVLVFSRAKSFKKAAFTYAASSTPGETSFSIRFNSSALPELFSKALAISCTS